MECDREVIEVLNEIVARKPRWGFWKLYDRLRLDGQRINHKRLHRVYCAMKLNLPRRTKRRLPTRIRQPLAAPAGLNQIWALDFMADALYGGRAFRTLNLIDEGNRQVLGIEVAHSIPSLRVIRVMEQLIELHGKPRALRLDNGPELTAIAFTEWCTSRGIEARFIQPGKPDQNAFIERFNKTYRDEVLDAYVFETVEQVREITETWLHEYNEERPHDSLGRVPPLTFMPRPATTRESRFKLCP
jgi:putative transposase